jgi:hypothetical protein
MIRRTLATALGGLAAAVLADRWLGGLSVDEEGQPIRVPIRSRIEIDAPIDEVWARLVDIERQVDDRSQGGPGRHARADQWHATERSGSGIRSATRSNRRGPSRPSVCAAPSRRFIGSGLITLDTLRWRPSDPGRMGGDAGPPVLPNLAR